MKQPSRGFHKMGLFLTYFLISMRLQLRDRRDVTLCNAYVPTLPEDRLDQERIYHYLQLQ